MDQPGGTEALGASTGAGRAPCPPGVSVYDADGEKLGTVSDWQDIHNFLIVHKGRLFGHDTYIPHAAIKYSDMNGVYLSLRQGDLTSMKQPPEQTASIPMALPILVPDMGVAAVAAIAFADHATSHAVPVSNSSASSAVEVAHENTVQAGALPERVKSRRMWRRSNR